MPRQKRTIKQLAETFETRRGNAELYLDTSYGSDHAKFDQEIYTLIRRDLKAAGVVEKPGPFGTADLKNVTNGRGFRAMKFPMWRRKEIFNRLRWLRGELTRLMINKGWKQKPDAKSRTREELISVRRLDIQRHMKALEDFLPLHKEIEQQKRNKYKREKRITTKKTAYRAEVKKALNESRAKIGLAPKKEPVKLRSWTSVMEERERAREANPEGSTLGPDQVELLKMIAASPRRPISED